jgi:recombinational DNA repair protein RecR
MTDANASYPSLPDQGKNLAKFAFEVVKNAMQSDALFVSDEIKQKRLAICRTCEYYDESQVRCKHCGCFLEHKTKFALDSCPVDKWKVSDTDWMNGKYDDLLQSLQEPDETNGPVFPAVKNVGDQYSWNNLTWTWNGSMWDLHQ